MDQLPHTNRLSRETSPYLRQHSHNPVDWFPWGEEALGRARALDRPIFLSIGYSACHWCHVMAHESFEDEATARLLNQDFVAIKVDREERPDLDAVYMNAVQAMTGSGGWPLTVFLTPTGEPFFGGTYFPPEQRWGRPSFCETLATVAEAWREQRPEILAHAAGLVARLKEVGANPPAPAVDLSTAERLAAASLGTSFDPRWGGFGGAPKFPTPARLFFLLDRANRDSRARHMLEATLDGMAAGGMWDWLGGGFHRYSVDERWLVPHFEKMLVDNALLARAYGAAAVRLGEERFTTVARATADWMIRDMQGSDGGFVTSTDADSEGEEGRFFTWTAAEVEAAVPGPGGRLLVEVCGLSGAVNFEAGRNVLRPVVPLAEAALACGVESSAAESLLAEAQAALWTARATRIPPATNEARLAAINGMALWSLTWLGAAFGEPRYLHAAERAVRFLRRRVGSDGRIERSFCLDRASGQETLEDVAWIARGFVEFAALTGDAALLGETQQILEQRIPHYTGAGGELFDTPDDGETLPLRPRSPFDGAGPSAAAVACDALLAIAALTGEDHWHAVAARALAAESGALARAPESATTLLDTALRAAAPEATVMISGPPGDQDSATLLAAALRHASAGVVVARRPTRSAEMDRGGSWFATDEADAPASAVICTGATCWPRVTSAEGIAATLARAPV